MSAIRVVLADDQVLFLRSLKLVLENSAEEINIVGTAVNGREAVKLVDELIPDVVLMDVRMPEMDGVEANREIHAAHPEVAVMMLTTFDDDSYVQNALHDGAVGYLLKDMDPEKLVSSIRALKEGAVQLSPSIMHKLMDQFYAPQATDSERLSGLNQREREILKLIAQGLDNREIAEGIHVAEQTVKNYVSSIYHKIGARDRIHAMRIALNEEL